MSARLSPCVGICRLDGASKLCLGCGRRLDEIAAWAGLSEADRRAVMAELPGRLKVPTETGATEPHPLDEGHRATSEARSSVEALRVAASRSLDGVESDP